MHSRDNFVEYSARWPRSILIWQLFQTPTRPSCVSKTGHVRTQWHSIRVWHYQNISSGSWNQRLGNSSYCIGLVLECHGTLRQVGFAYMWWKTLRGRELQIKILKRTALCHEFRTFNTVTLQYFDAQKVK